MIPLSLADIGKEHLIQKISGNTEIKKHLEDLGFTTGTKVVLMTVTRLLSHSSAENPPTEELISSK